MIHNLARTLLIIAAALLIHGCRGIDDDRIPNWTVNIRLTDSGLWNTYGVTGFGSHRKFIKREGIREPHAFPYSETSATGFGGVLLISGMDPFTGTTDCPLAYDLACPVERDAKVTVSISPDTFKAVCGLCHSTFDVTMGGGAPTSGPAASKESPCGMRRYQCLPSGNGGYLITN